MPLIVCATPIGNLDDVSPRLLRSLEAADTVLCEDTRRTRILLDRHGIAAGRLVSYHRHNEAERVSEMLPRLLAGEQIALVSDAGLPGIGDPGVRIVAAAVAAGVEITVIPGPSAVETAIVASGFACPGYRFLGWLPRRAAALTVLWEELSSVVVPCAAFESPRRLPASLASLAGVHPNRAVAVSRELTKRFEETVRGTAAEVAERFARPPKGEITVVIAGSVGSSLEAELDRGLVAAVEELVASGASRRTAAAVVARLGGVSRRALYHETL